MHKTITSALFTSCFVFCLLPMPEGLACDTLSDLQRTLICNRDASGYRPDRAEDPLPAPRPANGTIGARPSRVHNAALGGSSGLLIAVRI